MQQVQARVTAVIRGGPMRGLFSSPQQAFSGE
jgi:hypothetical protein